MALDVTHRTVEANGLRMHVAEQGFGQPVILCHGFPECWYSWRHQLAALSEAGFRAIAPDMRGYGQTDQPREIERYTLLHLVGDMVGLLDALGLGQAVIAGHDWGATVAWHCAMLRPDRFRAVIGLSVPFRPRSLVQPTSAMPQDDVWVYYQRYFQRAGQAEGEFDKDVRRSLRSMLWLAGDAPRRPGEWWPGAPVGMLPRHAGFLDNIPDPGIQPAWFTDTDLDYYVAEFTRTGFRGGLNWYRNIDRSWELLAGFDDVQVNTLALYMVGDRDPVLEFPGAAQAVMNLSRSVPRLRASIKLPGCGHWIQQERPAEVNNAMIEFLLSLPM